MVSIKTLGILEITVDGNELGPLSLRAKVLLTYLVVEGGHHSRRYLATMFWPDSPETKANTSLRVVLSELRKFLGEDLISTRENIGIHPGFNYSLDIHDLEKALQNADLEGAINLYQGDFLTGIFIPGSIEFENWHRWQSENIRRRLTKQLETAISRNLSLKNYDLTEEYSLLLLKIDPTNEIANQHYAITLTLNDHPAAALNHISSYKDILKEELGLDLPAETLRIQDLIKKRAIDDLRQIIHPLNNLPKYKTNFIGREKDIASISRLIDNPNCRWISLVGPGGIGKTRLASRVASANIANFPDGSFFVPLENVSTTAEIYPAIGRSLDIRFGTIFTDMDPKTQLLDYLDEKRILLVLDRLEHLGSCGNALSSLLSENPNLHILTTSRHKQNIKDEWVFHVEGLDIEEPLKGQQYSEAVRLFVARFQQAQADKSLTDDEMGQIVQICNAVEGMPLGIELAATWTPVISLSEIISELESDFGFLDHPLKGVPEKHQNLKAVFDSSWKLLEIPLRKTMQDLSVFEGEFTRQAAQEVCMASLAGLAALVDRSLLHRDTDGKFKIHRLIHEFCSDLIDPTSLHWQEIKDKHISYYSRYISDRIPAIFEFNQAYRLEVQNNFCNIFAALKYKILSLDTVTSPTIIQDLFSYFLVQGWHEGSLIFQQIIDYLDIINDNNNKNDQLLRASIQAQKGFFLSNLGLTDESEIISQTALKELNQETQSREAGICANNLGINAIYRGEYDKAKQYLNHAIKLSSEFSCYSVPSFYLWLGYLNFLLGEYDEGLINLETSLRLFEEDQNHWGRAFSLSKIGLALDGIGNYEEAIHYHKESLGIFEQTGDHAGQGYALSRMCLGSLLQSNFQQALVYGEEGYENFKQSGHRWGVCVSLIRMGYAYVGLGDYQKASDLLEDGLRKSHKHQLDPISLHAIGGYAIIHKIHGNMRFAVDLARYIFHHPMTPTVYKDLCCGWFNKKVFQKSPKEPLPSLDNMIQNVLDHQMNN